MLLIRDRVEQRADASRVIVQAEVGGEDRGILTSALEEVG
jgi:hypothetical protein